MVNCGGKGCVLRFSVSFKTEYRDVHNGQNIVKVYVLIQGAWIMVILWPDQFNFLLYEYYHKAGGYNVEIKIQKYAV